MTVIVQHKRVDPCGLGHCQKVMSRAVREGVGVTSPWQGTVSTIKSGIAMMSGVGSRETGLDSLFASKPIGPGFEPCLGQSAKLAGAPKPLCLNQIDEICQVSVKRWAHALRLISLAGLRSGLVGLLTVTQPPAVGHPGRQGRPLQGGLG